MPSVAAVVSWMDSMKLPMREIHKKYTKSELVLMGWDSKEKAYQLRKKFPRNKGAEKEHTASQLSSSDFISGVEELETSYKLPNGVNNGVTISKKLFNDEGELDLRKATGPQALGYMNALGFNIVPIIKP